jgi:outer membrane protein assembly factor BamB
VPKNILPKSNKILLYPNPAKDKLYISNADIGSRYEVYDNTGRRIGSGRISNTIQEIYTADIAAGIYYISITEEGGNSRRLRFVKE